MHLTTWIGAFLLTISLTGHTVWSDSHVIIRPTDSGSSICGDHATCHTLSDLISNESLFSDDSTLELNFLVGTHKVTVSSAQLKIEKKRNVTLCGENVEILCETALAFIFQDIESLEIRGLTFSNCGGEIYSNHSEELMLQNVSAALFLSNIHTLHLESIVVTLSKGYGLFALNLYGNAYINSCSFLDSNINEKCTTKNPVARDFRNNLCVQGGNVALYFFTRTIVVEKLVNITIANCTIKGGSDQSKTTANCTDRQKAPFSPSTYRANGLAVVFGQESYRVSLLIHSTLFTRNIGKPMFPAVLVHDFSNEMNQVIIYNTHFRQEGTLVFSSIKNYTEGNMPSDIFAIKNCSFVSGLIAPGFDMCIKPTKLLYGSPLQKITISNSSFSGYTIGQYLFRYFSVYKPIIRISYSFMYSSSFPNTLIEVERCTFFNNSASPLNFHLNKDSFLDHRDKLAHCFSSIVTVKHSKFGLSTSRLNSALQINVSKSGNLRWKYVKIDQNRISITSFSNCTFSLGIQVADAYVVFRNCTFRSSKYTSTAVQAVDSLIAVDGWNSFKEIRSKFGGAFNLERSMLLLMPNSETLVLRNTANYGGGVYATPIPFTPFRKAGIFSVCSIATVYNADQAQIEFIGNQGFAAGHSIFGGKYVNCTYNCTRSSQCYLIPDTARLDFPHIPKYIRIVPYSSDFKYTEVSSPANRICLCEKGTPTGNCSVLYKNAFPGQVCNISLIALGTLTGSTPATVTAVSGLRLNIDSKLLLLSTNCTTFSYSVHKFSPQMNFRNITLRLSDKTPRLEKVGHPGSFLMILRLLPCPLGLVLSSHTYKCECHHFFKTFGIKCNNKKGTIHISEKQWVGYYNNSQLAITDKYPLDYLAPGDKRISLNRLDDQCNFNRTGILCGACPANLSMVLGSSNCKECSNLYLLLIIPFALAGLVLVVLLLKCNLTVSVGHINGIIFYANILQVNRSFLFPNQSITYQIFSVFISWINLDLGIEICFFENMNSHVEAWLQFVFPVYLWIIIGLIILAARFSSRLGRLIGNNSVPVLATLFLLSYAKLLRTIITVVSFTFVDFEGKFRATVWLEDGNVKYFQSAHIALVFVALIFLFLFTLPLTLLVLLAPCLQARSHHKALKWVNRLKPFLDAYQGPYSDKFRFWTGVLLLGRLVLFLVYALNFKNDPSIGFFWTVVIGNTLAAILIWRSVYRHKLANGIELLSHVNLVILCLFDWLTTTTSYRTWQIARQYAAYISVAIMMLVFLVIVLYQVIPMIYSIALRIRKRVTPTEETSVGVPSANQRPKITPTFSVVELGIRKYDRLRETLLESD